MPEQVQSALKALGLNPSGENVTAGLVGDAFKAQLNSCQSLIELGPQIETGEATTPPQSFLLLRDARKVVLQYMYPDQFASDVSSCGTFHVSSTGAQTLWH